MEQEKRTRLQEHQDRGIRAKAILENPLFIEATLKAKEQIFAEIEATRWNDHDQREFLDKELRALKRVVGHLKRLLIDGESASKELQQPNPFARKIKRGAA